MVKDFTSEHGPESYASILLSGPSFPGHGRSSISETHVQQGSKLILFLSRFLVTIWSKKVAKCKMWVAKIEKKINHFFLGDTLCKIT